MTTRMPRTRKNLRMASSEGVNQVLSAEEKLFLNADQPRPDCRTSRRVLVRTPLDGLTGFGNILAGTGSRVTGTEQRCHT